MHSKDYRAHQSLRQTAREPMAYRVPRSTLTRSQKALRRARMRFWAKCAGEALLLIGFAVLWLYVLPSVVCSIRPDLCV